VKLIADRPFADSGKASLPQLVMDQTGFEQIDTSRSSFIQSAAYNYSNNLLAIGIHGRVYNYSVPSNIWEKFKTANSFGKFFDKYIKC
jgi:hypothetical protein